MIATDHPISTSNVRAAPPGALPAMQSRPLVAGDFRLIAQNGFGDGNNSYSYSSAWFNDHLYIGSNRHILPLLILRLPFQANFTVPPVPVPKDYTELDLRGQIWRYNPRTLIWDRVYHAPLVPGYQGRQVPQAFGFRGMTIFQGQGDSHPTIYTLPFVGRNVLEGVTLRLTDEGMFEQLPSPRVKNLPSIFGSFRSMVSFKGLLFVAPSSSKPNPKAERVVDGKEVHVTLANTSREAAVLCTRDPASGEWELSSPLLFGDRTNTNIMDMTVCGDYLYVGATNALNGFQLWRTKAEGNPPHHWEKVLDRGADRGPANQVALSMAEFKGALYIGTCIQNGGYDQLYHIGPAASELLRVHPDGSWDLIVGDPRITRQGLKVPKSGLRPGFNNPLASYFWRMCVHDGALYVGTCDSSSFVPFSNTDKWPAHVRRMLTPENLERYMEVLGGCELWRSTDGDNWLPVTRNGFGNRYNLGIRALVSTPHGLFVGTANPFGAQVAVRTTSGWKYKDNPRGGVEIWVGSNNHAPAISESRIPGLNGRLSSNNGSGKTDSLPQNSRRNPWSFESAPTYRFRERSQLDASTSKDPLLKLATSPCDLLGLSESYEDELSDYFGGDLQNVGYWRNRAVNPHDACRELISELWGLAPEHITKREHLSVLGVSGHAAALATELRGRFPGHAVQTISADLWSNIPDASCDVLFSIESLTAISQQATLAEVYRVLKPGGCALLADYLTGDGQKDNATQPKASHLPQSIELLGEQFARMGFTVCQLADVTTRTWVPFFNHSRNYWLVKLLFRQIETDAHTKILAALPGGNAGVQQYFFVSATRT